MNKGLNPTWMLWLLRLGVGGVFLYAGVAKMAAPQAFADSIATFKMLPVEWINILALSLPPFEVLAGVLMISGWQLRASAFAVMLLCAVFALALGQALWRGLEVDCGCFGSGRPALWKMWASLARDLALLAAAGWIYGKEAGPDSISSVEAPSAAEKT